METSNIPLLRADNGELLRGHTSSTLVLSSASSNWRHLVVEEIRFQSHYDLDGLMYLQHVIAINIGLPITCEFKKSGRLRRMLKGTGTVCLSPSHETFFRYCRALEENGSAEVLCVALDPLFVSQTAEALEVYPDRIELVEQIRETDPVLRHIALAVRAGAQGCQAYDSMYGESLATALSVHLVREYAAASMGRPAAYHGLSREKLKRAIEYIHDQLHTALAVSDIARAVHISPHHFTVLFKQSTGQSPYRYVIEARTRKAKELLVSGKYSISEIAHKAGFADQSHLTRHIKRLFGTTPGCFRKAS